MVIIKIVIMIFLTKYNIDSQGAVLIRPDGHVAWRSSIADEKDYKQLSVLLAETLLSI